VKKLLIGLVVLIAGILAAALIAPSFVDWNQYKGEIASRIEAATGCKLRIDGDISLSIVPGPYLSVGGVKFANIDGAAEPDMLRLKALALNIGFTPLLEGRVQVESLDLVEPVLTLERLADGRDNWHFSSNVSKPATAGAKPVPPNDVSNPADCGLPEWIQLDRFAVHGGTLAYRDDRTGKIETLGQIDGIVLAPQIGAIRAQGKAMALGQPIGFDMAVERPSSGGLAGLALKLSLADAKVDFTGRVADAGGSPALTGKLQASGSDLRRLYAMLDAEGTSTPPAWLAQNYALEGSVTASASKMTVADLVLRLGEGEARGGLDIVPGTPPRATLKLALNSIDLDKWLSISAPPMPAGIARSASGAPAGTKIPAQDGAGSKGSAADAVLALPSDIDVDFDCTVEALLYRGGVVRQVHLGAAVSKGEVSLKELKAEFPGSSDLTIYGTLRAPNGKPSFAGNVELASDDLRRFLGWLTIDADGVPAERLHQLLLTATLQLDADQLQLRDIDANIDSSHAVGGATILLQERPAFGVSLALDRINLDAYLPDGAANAAPAAKAPGAAVAASVPAAPGKTAADPSQALEAFDANFRLRADEITLRGERIQGLRFDGTLQGGSLTLHEASVDNIAGLKGSVGGKVTDLASKPKFDLAGSLSTPELATFLRFTGLKAARSSDQWGALALKGSIKGEPERFAIDLDAQTRGASYKSVGTLDFGPDGPAYELEVDVTHPDFAAFLRGFGYRPAGDKLGDLRLHAKAAGGLDKAKISTLDAKIGSTTVSGPIELSFDGPRPRIVARLDAGAIDLDSFLPVADPGESGSKLRPRGQAVTGTNPRWSTASLDLASLKSADTDLTLTSAALTYGQYRVESVKLAAILSNGTLDIAGLTGKLLGGDLKLTGRLDGSGEPTANLDFHLDGANLGDAGLRIGAVRLTKGALSATASLSTHGASEAALVHALNGNGSLKMQDGTLKGIDLAAITDRLAKLDRAVDLLGLAATVTSGGESQVKSITGSFAVKDGVGENKDLTIEADGTSGKGAGTVDLPRWYMEYAIAFTLAGAAEAPPFSIELKGPPDDPRKFLNANALQEYLFKRSATAVPKDAGKGNKEGSGSAGQPAAGDAGGENPSANAIIQDLLKNLNKKNPQ
jgi:uncharacterized protein involved in outer membrane biogenesis